jgi:hypothetical protein
MQSKHPQHQSQVGEVIGLGKGGSFFSRAHYQAIVLLCANEVIAEFPAIAAGEAGDLQSPTMPTTPAAHAANASEAENSPR